MPEYLSTLGVAGLESLIPNQIMPPSNRAAGLTRVRRIAVRVLLVLVMTGF
jgi:hypothetical protein